jgi:hypothetical protein
MTDSLTPSIKDSLSLNSFSDDNSSPANPIKSNGSPLIAFQMEDITSNLIDFLINSIKEEKHMYSDEQCLNIALEIIRANFPICASKYFKGETWKL